MKDDEDTIKELLEIKTDYRARHYPTALDGAVCCGSVKIIAVIPTTVGKDKKIHLLGGNYQPL